MSYRAWNPYKRAYPPGSEWRRIALRLWWRQVARRTFEAAAKRFRAIYLFARKQQLGWVLVYMGIIAGALWLALI